MPRAAYLRGREQLRRPDALAAELAQLAIQDGDFAGALREWLPAIRRFPGYRGSAVNSLASAPDSIRSDLLRQLDREEDFPARRLQADLRARWGDPLGALDALQKALPEERRAALEALRGMLDQLRTQPGRDARLAQGRTLELIAERSTDSERARVRLDAARAYTAAGEREAARRMLVGIAEDRSAPGAISAGASATLVQVLIGEGKLEDAARRLAEHKADMGGDEYGALRRRLVLGYLQAGELGRADSTLAQDSTVDGLALAGRIRLYHGDVAGAIQRFKAAGPFAGDRDEATERTALLAMLQPIEADSLPELGQALLALARGDTSKAVDGLERTAGNLPAAKGGAELRLMAGRLAAASRKPGDAERLLKAAAVPEAPGTAPAAELALAELLLDRDRPQEAVAQLEHLILTYPASALVPQARRRLDEARGAVPEDMMQPPRLSRPERCRAGDAVAHAPEVSGCRRGAPWLLVPMDDAQADHLKAYGLAFRCSSEAGGPSGSSTTGAASFLLPADARDRPRRGAQRHHDRAAGRRPAGPDPGRDRRAATWTRCRSRRRPRSRCTRRPTRRRGTTP